MTGTPHAFVEATAAAIAALDLPTSVVWRAEMRRRRTVGLTVEPGGVLVVAIPSAAGPADVARCVRDAGPWIARTVERAKAMPAIVRKELVGGESFPWLGHNRRLRLVDEGPAITAAPSLVRVRRDQVNAATVIGWYCRAGQEAADRWTPDFAARMGAAGVPRVEVRHLGRRRWGTYNERTHTIALNWAVFQLDRRLVDLVIAHEAAHAARPAGTPHGRGWQALMRRWSIDYRARKKELDEVGRSVWFGDVALPAPVPADVWGPLLANAPA